ncbi:MAG: hypothetical protein U0175_39645 [Caldilineaceae bacterium]
MKQWSFEKQKFRFGLLILMLTTALCLLTYATWLKSGVAEAAVNGSVPPGTIPPGPETPSDKAKITVIHAAPLATAIDDTAVDICTNDGTVVSGLAGLKYLNNASVFVSPGNYDLTVAKAGTNCATTVLDLAPFTLANQQEVVLVVTGDGTNQPVDALLLVTKAGVNIYYMPIIFNEGPTA